MAAERWESNEPNVARVLSALTAEDPVTWKVHREVALLLGWGRAILLQFAHPLVAAAIDEHSRFHTQPTGRRERLDRTLAAMLTLTFGSPDEVERTVAAINAVHAGVEGRLAERAGRFQPGTRYAARDPALLRWVYATLLDSFLLTYQTYVAPLTAEERDRYCRETAGPICRLGLPPEATFASEADLRDYLARLLAEGEIAVSETSRRLARALLAEAGSPLPWPLHRLLQLATIALLPAPIREAYGFPWTRRQAVLHALT
ncbi:MAG: DUF2236 domain-containing protein, partial [Thermomicrobiaceae bacterium]|nr:DUF2236 domain-containing protein [Thermomicrobiaceae bacterium]